MDDVAGKRVALVTPSYGQDYERCLLLCDSVDRFVDDNTDHYILVDNLDYPRFSHLANANRYVVNERDILPNWLFSFRTGFSRNARKIWVSGRTWPMRGWHVQQLRRIAIANHVPHEGLLYCDSDMLFVKPFSPQSLWRDGDFRLYRKPDGISDQLPDGGALHRQWTQSAAKLSGLSEPEFPAPDYINNMVTWRRQDVIDMCTHIETINSRDWVTAIARNRSFSECQIFGAYADGVKDGAGYWHAATGLCQTYWAGEALNRTEIEDFVASMADNQVAIGIQSFTGTDPNSLRYLIGN